jgi:hypothetical protein
VAAPDQVVRRSGTEALRFARGGIHRHLGRAIATAVVEGRPGLEGCAPLGTRAGADAGAAWAPLRTAAAETGPFGAEAVTTGGIGPGGLETALATAG